MNNYYYIVASLPAISQDWKFGDKSADALIQEIRNCSSEKDLAFIDFVLKGFDDNNLTPDFYREALALKSEFLKAYYAFDLNMRNAKVRYLNTALGRAADRDVIVIEDIPKFEQAAEMAAVLDKTDILDRERSIDNLYWEKLNRLSELHFFDMNVILSFIFKLHIIDRWHLLDEKTGREMFRRLVDEVRGTFRGVEYDSQSSSPSKSEKQTE